MTTAAPFEPAEPLGRGRTIVEASAGTGKTYTIAAMVTRLVAVEGLPLEDILVVTFTRAATAELKGRIRDRMVETLRFLDGRFAPAGADEHVAVLLGLDTAERVLARARLEEALTRFDRAQIFTIHGFAHRLLTQLGFRSRLSADLEPSEVDELLLRHAAADLVVRRFAGGGSGTLRAATKTATALGAAAVATPDARIVPELAAVDGEPRVRAELAAEMRDVVARRLRSRGSSTFDDALLEARDALSDPEIGAEAGSLLRRRYAVALVDESQDTDPIQWQVIRAVFDASRLVVIGDPKQSIYAFRGADVESYLAAVDDAPARRTLQTNWRSDGPLLAAFDVLFDGAVFGDERIGYHPMRPAPQHRPARIRGVGAALRIRRFSPDLPIDRWKRNPSMFLVAPTREAVAADASNAIVELLTSGAKLVGDDGWREVAPGDIAVLCRTRKQVEMVREHLTRRGVPSVAARNGGVFTTPAAEEWRRFLIAVERPDRVPGVLMAATTIFVGETPAGIADLSDEDALALQRRFRSWQNLLHEHGVPALFNDLDRSSDLAGRVLARADGERTMTDLVHIAEAMHTVWRRRRIGSLVVWLEAAMAEAERNAESGVDDPEGRQRRLETDDAAVHVQTIHASKGLEFPIVMAPYLWDLAASKPEVPVFHDPDSERSPRPRLIDVGGKMAPDFERHQSQARAEAAAEEARLLYVALTRARHHVMVWWIENAPPTASTKLHELLTRYGPEPGWLVDAAGGAIESRIMAEMPAVMQYTSGAGSPGSLDRARLDRALDYAWRRVSFSSLSPEHPLGGDADTSDEPDRLDETAEVEDDPPAVSGELSMAELPRGARFGSLVHHVLERVPFDVPDPAGAIRVELARATRHTAWDFDSDVFAAGLAAAVETPLGPEADAPALRDLDPSRLMKEMVFDLPVRTGSGSTSLKDVAAVMLAYLPSEDPHREYAGYLHRLRPSRFRGFLTGAIDLTTAVPGQAGERFVVIDYKSNALPAFGEEPGPLDYGPRRLVTAMHDGNYVLQALLYQVALHRYLRWRLAEYDPAVHLGGSMYLFVRGMIGADTPVVDGERCGVARWSPPPEMIVAVSDLFAREAP